METKKLINDIKNLLMEYEKETGLYVDDITIYSIINSDFSSKNKIEYDVCVKVCEVK